jgi:hypothetical protein
LVVTDRDDFIRERIAIIMEGDGCSEEEAWGIAECRWSSRHAGPIGDIKDPIARLETGAAPSAHTEADDAIGEG